MRRGLKMDYQKRNQKCEKYYKKIEQIMHDDDLTPQDQKEITIRELTNFAREIIVLEELGD